MHHVDYLDAGDGHALCGIALENPQALTQPEAAHELCPDCEARLVFYHLEWWRQKAEAANKELEELRAKFCELQDEGGDQGPPVASEGHAKEIPAEPEPTTLIDRAVRELTELCRQFNGAVPYWRLKKTMQEFSDRLDTDQRVLLAEEIGADGSLIRWATNKVESLGWQVTNSPVQENSEMMWQEWLQEAQQPAPKKTKRRFGRPR
ncbi:hypothetical protein A5651_01445 [Mycobacterium sp. 1274761.0]|nr:hypothetical protein A5651_01445 [Mycobacterium sp. 1274761.0]